MLKEKKKTLDFETALKHTSAVRRMNYDVIDGDGVIIIIIIIIIAFQWFSVLTIDKEMLIADHNI